jgi:hypothetical protein
VHVFSTGIQKERKGGCGQLESEFLSLPRNAPCPYAGRYRTQLLLYEGLCSIHGRAK